MTESSIKKLPQILINRIAAGEVIERPSSVVKELVENSIDADASNVEVEIEDGGRGYICVKDDGKGMSREDIALAIERHATSKLPDENLFNINSFGFRGEALPSIASISKTKISSLAKGSNQAWQIEIEGGKEKDIKPSNIKTGTIIEIRDLFYATPARLKFLKTERTERARIVEVIKRLAMANPKVNFILRENGKNILNYVNNQEDILNPRISRLAQILGKDFEENSVEIDAVRDNAKVSGYASIPTYNKGNSLDQYLFVNNRPVKDRVILGALKGAYHDFLAPQRYAVAALFIDLPAHEVDVNVHPAKAEVRFRFESEIRGLLVGSIKSALASAGHRASTTISDQALSSFRTEKEDRQIPLSSYQGRYGNSNSYRNSNGNIANRNFNSDIYSPIESGEYGERSNANLEYSSANQQNNIHNFNSSEGQFLRPNENSGENSGNPAFSNNINSDFDRPSSIDYTDQLDGASSQEIVENYKKYPLGTARAQLHENYIVAQTNDSIVIVDQHAAHERLVYERMKISYKDELVKRQTLLIPEIIKLDEEQMNIISDRISELDKFGLKIEIIAKDAIQVSEIPMILNKESIKKLISDIIDDYIELGEQTQIQERIEHILETMACHGSIRSGRRLNIAEMNNILREMEETPYSGQCNHGRPTYVKIDIDDIEKLFGRK